MTFGKALKELRQQKNITQSQFSEIIGVHSQTVSKWERDLELPDLAILHFMANALDVSVDTLLLTDCDKSASGSFSSAKMGNAICRLRKRSSLTQAELARRLGVSPDTVSKWERGVISPKLDMLLSVAKFFNVAPSFIYYGVIPKAENTAQKRNYFKWIISLVSLFIVSIVLTLSLTLFKGNGALPNNNHLNNSPSNNPSIPSTSQEPNVPTAPNPTTNNSSIPSTSQETNALTTPISPTTAFMHSIFPVANGMIVSNEKEICLRVKTGEKVVSATKGQLHWQGGTNFFIQDEYGYKAVYYGVTLKNGYVNGLTVEIGHELGTITSTEQSTTFTFGLYSDETALKVTDYLPFSSNLMPLPVKNYAGHYCPNKDEMYYNETSKSWQAFDIAFFGNVGDEIVSCFDGIVTAVQPAYTTTGASVTVKSSNGFVATYQNVSAVVQKGDTISLGQTLGLLTEPSYLYSQLDVHLHFSLQKDNKSTYEADYLLF